MIYVRNQVGGAKQAELDHGGGGLDAQCTKPCSLPKGSAPGIFIN